MRMDSLSPEFSSEFSTGNNRQVLTVRAAIGLVQSYLGYDASEDPKYLIHDLMHILADAVSGVVADERRAGIMEYHMLTHSLQISDISEDGYITRWKHKTSISMEELAETYAKNGANLIKAAIYSEREKIVRSVSEDQHGNVLVEQKHVEEIEKQFQDNPRIKGLESLLYPDALTQMETQQAIIRAQTMGRYFRENNQGRKLDQFTLDEIMEMPLHSFGIRLEILNNKLCVETLIPIAPPVFTAQPGF